MKQFYISMILILSMGQVFSQTEYNISMQASYVEDVFIDLDTEEVSNSEASSWHLAFEVSSAFSNGIRINDGHGVTMKTWPDGTIEDWATVDTTGQSEWPSLHNSLTSWSAGAFNISADGSPFDFSWGYYTGDPDHDVVGDSIYVLSVPGVFTKKLRIDVLDAGNWTFTIANIDGSEENSNTFSMSDYDDKILAYYNAIDNSFADREPSADWDIVFSKYYGMTAFGPGGTAGVLAYPTTELIVADGVEPENADYTNYDWNAEDISVIGNDWKSLNDFFQWEIVGERSYFVETREGNIYQIAFTSFEGSGTGNISFNVEFIGNVGVNEQSPLSFNLYPNPNSTGNLNIELNSLTKASTYQIEIYTLNGQLLRSESIQFSGSNYTLDTSSLARGVYVISIIHEDTRFANRLIVQ